MSEISKIKENKLVGGTTTWGPVYEHLWSRAENFFRSL